MSKGLQAVFALAQGEQDVAFLKLNQPIIVLQKNSTLMEGLVVGIVCQNLHTSHREFLHLLALFPTPLPILPSPSIALKSPWEDNRLIVFLPRGEG